MNFFVGWSHSDAKFSDYYPECSMLIGAVPDNRSQLKSFKTKPKNLILDSGSIFYMKKGSEITSRQIFNIQHSLLKDCDENTEVRMVAYDEPMLNKQNLSERYKAMEKTLFNAYEYLDLFYKHKFSINVQPKGVIQGYDRASVQYCAHELKRMGYKHFGIGSLLLRQPKEQIEIIRCAAEIVDAANLHVFGVTGVPQIEAMAELGINSFDSTRPTMAAAYFQIFYSRPFRTYFIPDTRAKPGSARLDKPLPCDCPVCKEDPNNLLISSPRKFTKLRSIHNLYHLSITIKDIFELSKGG